MTELCKTGVLDSIEQQFYGNISFAVRVDIMKNYCIEIFGVKDNKLISEYAFLSSSIVELPELISRLKDGISEEELSFISETLIYIFKYRMLDAMSKSLLRLRLESKFKKPIIKEIDNLVNLVGAYR